MPSIKFLGKTPRKVLPVFYVLDTSGSMEGERIAALNKAMEETTWALSQQAEKNADALVKIAVLEFNSSCQWVQPEGPEDMEDFIWSDLLAGGMTDVGRALKELDDKLSPDKFLQSDTGVCLPVIIFMTDGYATDNYKKALEQIRKNKWFVHGTKVGFAIGDNPDIAMIADVVGDSAAVIYTEDMEKFASQLKFVTATASQLCSISRTSAEKVTGSSVVERAVAEEVISDEEIPKDVPYTPMSEDLEEFGDDYDSFFDADFSGE